MYSELSHAHIGALLQAFTFTVASPTVTLGNGKDDVSSSASASAGKVALTIRETGVFKRGPILLCSHGANVAGGGFGTIDTLPASNVLTAELLSEAGAGDNGTGYALALGWRMSNTNKGVAQLVKATFPRPVLVPMYVSSAGVVLSDLNAGTVVKNATGDYTVYFRPACSKAMAAVAVPVNATAYSAQIYALTGTSVNVKTFDTSNNAVDTAFVVLVALSKSYDLHGRGRNNILVPIRKARLVAGRVTVTAGTPAITIGGATGGIDYAVTDNGVGDYTITFNKAFKRAPVVIPCSVGSRVQLKSAASTTAVTFASFNAGGAAADDSFDFIAVGSDSSY